MTHTALQPSYIRAHRVKTHTDASTDDSAPRLPDQSEAIAQLITERLLVIQSVKLLTDRKYENVYTIITVIIFSMLCYFTHYLCTII